MNMKKLASIMGIGLGLALAAGPANSISISLWSFQDDDIEFILRKNTNGEYEPITSGNLQVNDVLWAILEMPTFTINGNNAIPAGKEVTGVAAVQITGIAGSGVGTVYTFGPFSDFQSVLLANGGPNLTPYIPPGTNPAVAAFINNATSSSGLDRNLILDAAANPASNCASLLDCTREATQGSLLQIDGFGRDADEFWVATQVLPGGNDIGTVLGTGNTTLVAAFNFALSNLFNTVERVCSQRIPTGVVDPGCDQNHPNNNVTPDGWIQVLGSGTVLGGQGLTNGAIAHSDFDAKKYVPEPATLALFGIGLVGLGARFRRTA